MRLLDTILLEELLELLEELLDELLGGQGTQLDELLATELDEGGGGGTILLDATLLLKSQ